VQSKAIIKSTSAPDINWIKAEVKQIFDNKRSVNGEIINDIIQVDVNDMNITSLIIAHGNFTDKENNQLIITIPGNSVGDKNLGWETNLWLLVQQDSLGAFHTINSIRGDVAYQNSVVDMNGDGYSEISMVNKTIENNVQNIAYKLYSFYTQSLLYVSETQDYWNLNKEAARKTLHKGGLMYNVLETQYVDIDSDGKMEIVEKWVEFRFNGGKRINDIELKKQMKIISRILTFENGFYQVLKP
jgi:hypothetical protein